MQHAFHTAEGWKKLKESVLPEYAIEAAAAQIIDKIR
jgi:hypothetical protein